MIQTRILTQHAVTKSGAFARADMTLDDSGAGSLTIIEQAGQQITFDATRIDELIEVLTECSDLQKLASLDAVDLVTGGIDLL
jgi:hypothetical protein